MKLTDVGLIVCIVALIYFTSIQMDRVYQGQSSINDRIDQLNGRVAAVALKLQASDREANFFYKLQKNQELLKGTPCLDCHNTMATSLPIYKRTPQDAVRIIRRGTTNSVGGGMPRYSFSNQKSAFYLDEIKIASIINKLYTQENLSYVKEPFNGAVIILKPGQKPLPHLHKEEEEEEEEEKEETTKNIKLIDEIFEKK